MKTKQTLTEELLGKAFIYSGAYYISIFARFFIDLVIKNLLGPYFAGMFSFLKLIPKYLDFSHLGLRYALDKELPMALTKNKKEFDKLVNTGFSVSLLLMSFFSLVVIAFAFFQRNNYDSRLVYGAILISISSLILGVNTFLKVVVRSTHDFLFLSKYTLIGVFFALIFQLGLLYYFGFYGLLFGLILTYLFVLIYLEISKRFLFKLKLSFYKIKALFSVGFPIFLYSIGLTVLTSLDRIMIGVFLGLKELGFYTIAVMVFSYAFLMPNLITEVLFPKFYNKVADTKHVKKLKNFVLKPTYVLSWFLPIIVVGSVLVLPLLVHYILPRFVNGIFSAYILLFGVCFIGLIGMPVYLIISQNKQKFLVLISIILIIITLVLDYMFIKMGAGINGVAVASIIGFFIFSLLIISFSFNILEFKFFESFTHLIKIYFSSVYIVPLVLFLILKINYSYTNLLKDIILLIIFALISLVYISPLIWLINRQTNFLKFIIRSILEK